MNGISRRPRDRVLSQAELVLWHGVARKAQPLPGRKPLPRLPVPTAFADAVAKGLKAPPVTAGTDHRSTERLRRGQRKVDARLDLHGMTQSEAHKSLERFVRESAYGGRRMLLVITGKGSAGGGILRQSVPRWLAGPSLAALVLDVTPARPRHGGEGALYVVLRRLK